ncbi:hypothetical protein FHX42_000213 [Saccharopolyspora lacisalsi]|uniref:DUF4288 domain-containing protein n=1 Tax=Halosaccharopolyspora lacisalsi TaxID=1000566 RepID=A0A839DMZ7_9PSEU|nr:DUF4288 domain-containing protein [Halosaccharopolyspora lacisalsi]MBA8822884.1 hypothetical protein [Halosaccharopolyspora lacisalsi]
MSTPGDEPNIERLPDELVEDDHSSIDLGSGTIDPREHRPRVFATAEPESYVAVLVIESSSESPDYEPWYEESFVLLTAESDDEAREKAREYGKQHETSHHDEHQRLVNWKLKHVVEVKKLEDATFDDGSELYSRVFRDYSGYSSFEPRLGDEEL